MTAEEKTLARTVRHVAQANDVLDEALAARDEAIRAALAAKVPYARLTEMTKLSAGRIDQIRRHARI